MQVRGSAVMLRLAKGALEQNSLASLSTGLPKSSFPGQSVFDVDLKKTSPSMKELLSFCANHTIYYIYCDYIYGSYPKGPSCKGL